MSDSLKILINTLPKGMKPIASFLRHQESSSGLSTTRYIQDVSTCLLPKAVFSRSKEDLTENTFLETSEEALIYLTPSLFGEKIARKVFSKNLDNNLKNEVAKTGVSLLNAAKNDAMTSLNNKKIIPVKAAIALAAMIIPLTEFSLNYIKNLMTLKLFKKCDFKNIAALTNAKEDKVQQEKVKNSAKKHIFTAMGIYSGLLGLAALLASKGRNSVFLQKVSEFIVAPGSKLFKNNEKAKSFINKYFSIDFAQSPKNKLVLSKGQLTTCVLLGGLGYFGASADRGKENLKETALRFPIVALYVITGSELVEKAFKCLLKKFGKCKDVMNTNKEVVPFEQLGALAQKLAKEKGTTVKQEFKSLLKQKALIFGLPFLFAIGVMGFFVSWLTVNSTKKRYAKEHNSDNKCDTCDLPTIYKDFTASRVRI
ncbi:MAG: hypothetical protein K6A44_01195 [bacterium]|nr:hypothetical protein [bacterium]